MTLKDAQIAQLVEENMKEKSENDILVAQHQRNLQKVKELEEENKAVVQRTEESRKKIREMMEKMINFKDMLDKIIIKISDIRQEVFELRSHNDGLLLENERLGLRAAVGFENLTPRPNFRVLAKDYGIDLDLKETATKRTIFSSVQITETLMKKINDLGDKLKAAHDDKKGVKPIRTLKRKATRKFTIDTYNKEPGSGTLDTDKDKESEYDLASPTKIELTRYEAGSNIGEDIIKESDHLLKQIYDTKNVIESFREEGQEGS
jgi:hypothetical protein